MSIFSLLISIFAFCLFHWLEYDWERFRLDMIEKYKLINLRAPQSLSTPKTFTFQKFVTGSIIIFNLVRIFLIK